MKIVFDNVDELITFIKHCCPSDIMQPEVIQECTTDYDYEPVACEKCWRKYIELEVKKND